MCQCFLMPPVEMVLFSVWTCIIVVNIVAAKAETKSTLLADTAELNDHLSRTKRQSDCGQSHTQVDGKDACSGEMIFQENFSGNKLNTLRWNHEIFMPTEPNYEFVVFNDNPQITSAANGRLRIKPSLYEDEFVRRGILELSRCTGRLFTEECVKRGTTYNILPPVQSARITTKNSFSFKYGKVEVRAKLPAGDWLVPEIWLEPKRRVYGPAFSSGRIRIAFAHGNKQLTTSNGNDISSKILTSDVIMGTSEKVRGRSVIREDDQGWDTKFHNYTLIWEPDSISFMVDGGDREYIVRGKETLRELLNFDDKESVNWQLGSSLAPFDQEFYISLGLSAGGMKDFPDNCLSGSHPKPWKNEAVKAMLLFWEDREHWQTTWNKDTSFEVEHVTVQAL